MIAKNKEPQLKVQKIIYKIRVIIGVHQTGINNIILANIAKPKNVKVVALAEIFNKDNQ